MATEATTLREMAKRFEGYAQMWRCQGRDEDAAAMDQAAALYHRKASELEASWRNDDDHRPRRPSLAIAHLLAVPVKGRLTEGGVVNLNVTKVVQASKEWSKAEKALAIALWAETAAPKARRKYTRKAKASQPAAEAAPAKVKRAAKAGNGGAELGPKFPKPGAKRRGRPPGAKNKATMLPVEPAAPVAQA